MLLPVAADSTRRAVAKAVALEQERKLSAA